MLSDKFVDLPNALPCRLVGAYGAGFHKEPRAGLAVVIPLLIVGLATSPVQYVGAPIPGNQEGNSILYLLLKLLVHGRILPGGGYGVILNAIAFPAWFGLLITALNLLPIGSLDGGHVTYAVFGRRQGQIARGAWLLMLAGGGLLLLLRPELGLNM